jgi:hypothetical protein
MPPIYHFTDFDNLEPILAAGALQCHRQAPTNVDVGDQAIKGNRTWIAVDCGPGGVVCDYVPFYFATRSPMLFSIKCGNVAGVRPNQRRLLYFVSSTEAAYDAGLDCVFSDGNAAAYSITSFKDDPQELDTHVDWAVMKLGMWNNTNEDPDRRRRRMAEFLIHDSVPLELFTAIAVTDVDVQKAVASIVEKAGWDVAVIRRPGWYF